MKIKNEDLARLAQAIETLKSLGKNAEAAELEAAATAWWQAVTIINKCLKETDKS